MKLRTVHGAQQRMVAAVASKGSLRERVAGLERRKASQIRKNGNRMPSEGLVSNAIPQSTPYASQSK